MAVYSKNNFKLIFIAIESYLYMNLFNNAEEFAVANETKDF